MKAPTPPRRMPAVGDIWEDMMHGYSRQVRVLRVREREEQVQIQMVEKVGGAWVPAKPAPRRWSMLARFIGGPGVKGIGYSFLETGPAP